jgi:hypothetical protein
VEHEGTALFGVPHIGFMALKVAIEDQRVSLAR